MLDKCCIGRLVGTPPSTSNSLAPAATASLNLPPPKSPSQLRAADSKSVTATGREGGASPAIHVSSDAQSTANTNASSNASVSVVVDAAPLPKPTIPKTDWFQAATRVSLLLFAKNLAGQESVTVTCEARSLQVTLHGPNYTYERLVALEGEIVPEKTAVSISSLCATVTLIKKETSEVSAGADGDGRGS